MKKLIFILLLAITSCGEPQDNKALKERVEYLEDRIKIIDSRTIDNALMILGNKNDIIRTGKQLNKTTQQVNKYQHSHYN